MRHVPSVRAEDKGAVPQTCGLRNGLFGRQGGIYLPQRRGSRDRDLKSEVAGASGLRQMSLTAFSVCENRVYCVWKFVKN